MSNDAGQQKPQKEAAIGESPKNVEVLLVFLKDSRLGTWRTACAAAIAAKELIKPKRQDGHEDNDALVLLPRAMTIIPPAT